MRELVPFLPEQVLSRLRTAAIGVAAAASLGIAGPAAGAATEAAPTAPAANPVVLTPAGVSPVWTQLKVASGLELAGVHVEAEPPPSPTIAFADVGAGGSGVVDLPEPDGYYRGGRIRRGGSRHLRRAKDIRTFGVEVIPGYAILTGQVVGKAFGPGPVGTIRLMVNASTANQFFLDLSYQTHPMKDPRPMFFRTSVTPQSGFSGQMNIFCPAIYYAAVLPIGETFHSSAWFTPKFYLGLGPIISTASGKVTNAGSKGTVTGKGAQPFVQFTPGLQFDFRVYDYVFVGADFKYRLTVPTQRPDLTAEFSIPKMYIFESGLSVGYFFY